MTFDNLTRDALKRLGGLICFRNPSADRLSAHIVSKGINLTPVLNLCTAVLMVGMAILPDIGRMIIA